MEKLKEGHCVGVGRRDILFFLFIVFGRWGVFIWKGVTPPDNSTSNHCLKLRRLIVKLVNSNVALKKLFVTRAKRALYLLLIIRLGLRNVSTRIFNKQDIWVTSCLIKVTRPSYFVRVPSYFETLWYPHLYFDRKSNI